MTFPCPYCRRMLALTDVDVLSEAAAIHNSRRKTHGAGTGRPRGSGVGRSKCPKCGKFHKQEEMLKCKGETK